MNPMNPSEINNEPNLNLPQPVQESGMGEFNLPGQNGEPVANNNLPQSNPTNAPLNNQNAQQNFYVNQVAVPQSTGNGVSNTTNIVVPDTADDNDLIEKEWVLKAKKIVESNREDPYNQSKQMTAYRADYLRKRYNKIIKTSE